MLPEFVIFKFSYSSIYVDIEIISIPEPPPAKL